MSTNNSPEDSSTESSKKPNNFLRFSSMGFQMMVTIGAGAWGGNSLDGYYQNEKPIWTIVLSLAGIAVSLILVIRSANKMSKDD